jgi:hypothetical protein
MTNGRPGVPRGCKRNGRRSTAKRLTRSPPISFKADGGVRWTLMTQPRSGCARATRSRPSARAAPHRRAEDGSRSLLAAMGFSFSAGSRIPKFSCVCGAVRRERVNVVRPDGRNYTTEFVRCVGCRAMFHWKDVIPSPELRYGTPIPGGPHPAFDDPEFMARIDAAAARARKSRRSRR